MDVGAVSSRRSVWCAQYTPKLKKRTALLQKLCAYDSEEPDHANHYDYRSRYREVGFSSPWRWCEWRCCCSPSIEAAVCAVVLSEAASVPHWYRGLCVVTATVIATHRRYLRKTDCGARHPWLPGSGPRRRAFQLT